ncbi:ATP-binding protein [Kribbella deserti]|uniref:AAA family ATPase n=1 Tax=Kribbella deserti TaxID=1926257 RepID=A0ABV6QTL6_9ACTN
MAREILKRTTSPILVGRDDELRLLAAAIGSGPAVALVEGEAGIGKSRLIREVLKRPEVARLQLLIGYCQPLREPFPYGVVIEALREYVAEPGATLSPLTGVLRPLLPELAPRLPAEPPSTGDAAADRHRLFRAVRELLAAAGPTLLVVEDLHWADDGSRQLLRFLMTDPPDNLSVLATYRREDLLSGPPLGAAFRPTAGLSSAVIELQPLDVDEVAELSAAIRGEASVSTRLATLLYERTAGIPFVVEEALRGDHLLDRMEVPVLLRDAMSERLEALPPEAREVAHTVAVLGVPTTTDLLAAITGLDEQAGADALTIALQAGVLREVDEGRYTFRHALGRQAVYDSLPGPQRQSLHRRVADRLAGLTPQPLLQLAEHSRAAGRTQDWLRYAEAAADRASEIGEAGTATDLLQRVLADPDLAGLGVSGSDVDRLAGKLGKVAYTGLDQRDPMETLQRLLTDHRLSPAIRGEVRLYTGLLLIRDAEGIAASRAEIERALPDLTDRSDLAAIATTVLALPYIGTTPLSEIEPWSRRSRQQIARCTDPEERASMLANHLSARLHIGDASVLAEIEELPRAGTTGSEQRQLARAHCNLADACTSIGRFAHADALLRSGLRLAADCGAPFTVSTARSTRARLSWFTGDWADLDERASQLLDEYRDLFPVTSEVSLVLGSLAVVRGEWAEAETYLAGTGIEAPAGAISPIALGGFALQAWMRLARNDLAGAVQAVENGLELLRHKQVWSWSGELVPIAVAVLVADDRYDAAQRLCDELAKGIDGREAPLAATGLVSCRAKLAKDRSVAIELFTEAARGYEDLGAPYFAALTSEQALRVRLAEGDSTATDELAELAEVFDRMAAPRDAARCRHELRRRGGTAPSHRGRRGYGGELSPREQEVARLLGRGHTNREIAEVLFLSPRTVEQHVAKVLRKLGAVSRAELQRDKRTRETG